MKQNTNSQWVPTNRQLLSILVFLFAFNIGCKKLVNIPAPVDAITTSQVFENNEQATAAAAGMYFQLINSSQSFASYSTSLFAGMSADELKFFSQGFSDAIEFENNNLQPTNSYITNNFWTKMYSSIYSANAIIEGLGNHAGVKDSVKKELLGEAKFIRAFCNFYLTNLFGDIPLVTTNNWHKTNLISRSPVAEVYKSIFSDLLDAEKNLATDYSVGKGERVIPNVWAAKALLARAYLFQQDWSKAEIFASEIINNSTQYALCNNPGLVYLKNSSEAIWQLKQSNAPSAGTHYNATPEGATLIPTALNSIYAPYSYITRNLLEAFEPDDIRFTIWIDSTAYNGTVYYFPYKYKMGAGQAVPNGAYTEYYMMLRLAEQYLIRAEARANQKDLLGAISDINVLRNRAGLPLLSDTLTEQEVLTAIVQERRVELFAEWGHRWLDLIRWDKANELLAQTKGTNWQPEDKRYPIPQIEISTNPNLTQNVGY